jgi:hypothetical protein
MRKASKADEELAREFADGRFVQLQERQCIEIISCYLGGGVHGFQKRYS